MHKYPTRKSASEEEVSGKLGKKQFDLEIHNIFPNRDITLCGKVQVSSFNYLPI